MKFIISGFALLIGLAMIVRLETIETKLLTIKVDYERLHLISIQHGIRLNDQDILNEKIYQVLSNHIMNHAESDI